MDASCRCLGSVIIGSADEGGPGQGSNSGGARFRALQRQEGPWENEVCSSMSAGACDTPSNMGCWQPSKPLLMNRMLGSRGRHLGRVLYELHQVQSLFHLGLCQ